jgi:hypothetical protein
MRGIPRSGSALSITGPASGATLPTEPIGPERQVKPDAPYSNCGKSVTGQCFKVIARRGLGVTQDARPVEVVQLPARHPLDRGEATDRVGLRLRTRESFLQAVGAGRSGLVGIAEGGEHVHLGGSHEFSDGDRLQVGVGALATGTGGGPHTTAGGPRASAGRENDS